MQLMNRNRIALFCAVGTLFCGTAQAQLTVDVSPPKAAGRKVVVLLAIKNGFAKSIDSARAVVFVSDEEGKVVARDTRWIIGGGSKLPPLAAGATNVVNFVVSADKPIATTNLTVKVSFTRFVLEGDEQADISKAVIIRPASH
jgi:hypothetical protein